RAPRLKVPFPRKCPDCSSPRIVQRGRSTRAGDVFRAWCRLCQKWTTYDRHGHAVDLRGGRGELRLPFDRPRCRCGTTKVIGGRRFKHKLFGDLVTFVCPRARKASSPPTCSW